MNKPNNKRSRDTDEAIVRAAFEIMVGKHKPAGKITVREICELAGVNRSTFYAHYLDVYDLFDKVERSMAKMCTENIWQNVRTGGIQAAIESLFEFVKGYREFYQIYFKEVGNTAHLISLMVDPFEREIKRVKAKDLGYGVESEMTYHYNFYTAGIAALLSCWLERGCQETPAQMVEVLLRIYGPHSLMNTWTGGLVISP